MKPSQEHIALQLGTAFDLSLQDAFAILLEVASAVRAVGPTGGRLVQQQEQLFDLVERLANGDAVAIEQVAQRLPYERKLSAHFVQIASLGWLEQSRLDAAIGLRRQASVWAEVNSSVKPRRGNPFIEEMREESGPLPSTSDMLRRANEQAERARQAAEGTARRVQQQQQQQQQQAARRTWDRTFAPRQSPSTRPPLGSPGPWYTRIFRGLRSKAPPPPMRPHGLPAGRRPSAPPPRPASPPVIRPQAETPIVMNDPGAPSTSRPAPQANEYRVWFGTNRELVGGDANPSFSGRRGKIVTYGHCDVYVPESHKIGELGSNFIDRLVNRTDDRLKLRRTCPLQADSFWLLLRSQLEEVPLDRRHAVVFIHGYNVSFDGAALRAAQIGVDLQIEGAMAFFSWPSKGDFDAYKADEASIEASEPAIADFLVNFADRTGATGVHIIAHSMGNRGVLRAVDKIARDAQRRAGIPFANFILAAPDIDAEAFLGLSKAYKSVARRTTLYVSERDRALALSGWLSEYPRAGYAPPVTVCDGIDTISVTNIDLTVLGHSYFGEAREVLNDMHSLIFKNEPPGERFGIKAALTDAGEAYWVVGR